MVSKITEISVIYDKECPICNNFASHLKKSKGISVVNAREQSTLKAQAKTLDMNIDRGLVVYSHGSFFYGYEAIIFIAKNIKVDGLLSKTAKALFSNKHAAKTLYPIFVFCRRTLLFVLGRPMIYPVKSDKKIIE